MRHKGKVYAGEQAAILDREIWQQAQVLLRQTQGGERVRNRPGALLQDLLRCGVCGSRMVAGYSTKKNRRYGYYVCRKAQQQDAASCLGQSIPAARIEGALLAGLGALAEAGARQPLREALQGWSALERGARRRRLASVVERIDYDGGRGEVSVCWRTPGMDGASVSIPVRNPAAMRLSPPAPEQPTRNHRGPAAADYAVAGVGRTIRRTAAGWHGAGLRGFGAPGRRFARADHPDHESAESGTGDPGAYPGATRGVIAN